MMNNIKMSDVFDGKVDPDNMLLDSDIAMDASEHEELYAAALAINAYDANQERIAVLEKTTEQQQAMLNFQAAQYNVMVDWGIKREKEVIRLKNKLAEQN